ncbi:hypothetical protein ACQSET_23505 [Salmonella enterica]|uniref:hypothetical protein n=1 Tax=Salmonella enterica TaxID=28901 RepID=UPI003D3185D0|nr:hypothetical protein [Salmonella enterica]
MNTEKSLCELNYAWLNLVQKMLLKDRSTSMVETVNEIVVRHEAVPVIVSASM